MPGPALPIGIGAAAGGLAGLFGGTKSQPAGPLTPAFAGPAQNLILSMFGTQGQSAGGPFGFRRNTFNPAQNILANFGQRFGLGAGTEGQLTPEQRTLGVALPQLLGLGQGDAFGQTEEAFRPIFQRNLADMAAVTREQGPRFAAQTQQAIGQQSQRAGQDFNAFLQQAAEQVRARQINALTAAGQLGLNSQQLQVQAFQPFLQALLGGGLSQGYTQSQSPLGAFFGGALQGAGLGSMFGGAANAANTARIQSATNAVFPGGLPFGGSPYLPPEIMQQLGGLPGL